MTQPDPNKQQQLKRFRELFKISRQRYLEAGGDPRRAADESYLTDEEKQEAKSLGEQIFDNNYIQNHLKTKTGIQT